MALTAVTAAPSRPTGSRSTLTGIFYAQGMKANVLFFDAKPAREKPWTERLWVYDLRTHKHFTLKMKPLRRADVDDFVAYYRPGERHKRKQTWSPENQEGRCRAFKYDEWAKRTTPSADAAATPLDGRSAAILCHAGRVALPGGRRGDFLVDDPARKAMAHCLCSGCRAGAARGRLR